MGGKIPTQTYLCKVISVADYSCECEPVDGGANFLNVRLRSVLDNGTGGLILKPKKDSLVLIAIIENNDAEAFVIGFSDIDELFFKNTEGMTLEVKKDVININGDAHDGLAKVKALTSKLNSLEDDINNLKLAFNSWIVTPNDGGAKLKAAAAAWSGQNLSKTQQYDIENKKVKHG